jgi:hypothetical protein
MTKQEITYYDNLEMKTFMEYMDDVLVVYQIYNQNGLMLYEKTLDKLTILNILDDVTCIYVQESSGAWRRHYYNIDGEVLFGERSNSTWYEYRYNEIGNKEYFLSCYGSIHLFDKTYPGGVKYIDVKDATKHCSWERNREKTQVDPEVLLKALDFQG